MHHRYLIGTLFEEEEQTKKTNLNNMKARDPKGNVRWKGAFTGGFQAGYRNTCGSKEGWTPASFVSSVTKRAEKTEQNIFDYMDKDDLGRQSISQNIGLKSDFTNSGKNSLNVRLRQSVGEKILDKLRKEDAFQKAPENIQDLAKLLQNYAKQEDLPENQNALNYEAHLKDISFNHSVGDQNAHFQDDDFIANYEDFFKKVIRDRAKEETEQQIAKRRQENKVYFDFTKPLEEQPEYLKEIQQIESTAQPRKRRKNAINEQNLSAIFASSSLMRQFEVNEDIIKVPEDYDPYYRLRKLKNSQSSMLPKPTQKLDHKPKMLNIRQRSDILGEVRLADKFRAGTSVSSTSYVREGQQQSKKSSANAIKRMFQDEAKNQRYIDYVDELEGKKISSLVYESWEEAQKQKSEFERIYKLQKQSKGLNNAIKGKIESLIEQKGKKQIQISRDVSQWKPDKILCKRFNILVPHTS